MAVAKVAPGPQPPLPLHPQKPHPPSPHGFLFPSPYSSPASHCLASSLWTTCKAPLSDSPAPQLPAYRSPSPLHSQDPISLGFLEQPPPTRPSPPWLRKAHSHSSQFPFVLGKSPAAMGTTMLPVPA